MRTMLREHLPGSPLIPRKLALSQNGYGPSRPPTLPCLPTPSEETPHLSHQHKLLDIRRRSHTCARHTGQYPNKDVFLMINRGSQSSHTLPHPHHPRPYTQQTPSATPLSTIDMIKLPGPQTDKGACRGHRPLKLKAKKATVLRAPRPHIQTTLT